MLEARPIALPAELPVVPGGERVIVAGSGLSELLGILAIQANKEHLLERGRIGEAVAAASMEFALRTE